jgi:hypothetical protein
MLYEALESTTGITITIKREYGFNTDFQSRHVSVITGGGASFSGVPA